MRGLTLACGLVVLSAILGGSFTAEAFAADVPKPEPKLGFVPLAVPGAILTKSDFVNDKGVPVLFYSGLVIPKTRVNFTEQDKTWTLKAAGGSCSIEFDGSTRLTLKAGGAPAALEKTMYGLNAPAVKVGKQDYQLAIPRAFTYLGKAAMYVRSGCVQQVKVGDAIAALYDDNLDGVYDAKNDLIRLGEAGEANVFAPTGGYVPTAAGLFKIDAIAADGSAITCSKHEGDEGKIAVSFPVANVEGHFALASDDGKVSFGMVAAKQTLSVLPGNYKLLYGFVYYPKDKTVVCLVLPAKMASVAVPKFVEPPKPDPNAKPDPNVKAAPAPLPTAITFGEAVELSFSGAKKDGKIVVTGPVVAQGKLGESYVGFAQTVNAFVYVDDPANKRPNRISLGQIAVGEDGAIAGDTFTANIPEADGKPLAGKYILQLEGSVPGIGRVAGSQKIEL